MEQTWIRGALLLAILAMYWTVGLYPYTFQMPRYVLNEGAWTEAGGLVFAGPGMARTPDVPTWLQALPNATKLVLRVGVRTEQARQGGPARILTISDGVNSRNLTLGQQDADLVLRVRRPGASENGTPAFRIADVFQEPVSRNLAVEIDGARMRLAVDGMTYVDQEFDHPILSTWDPSFPLAFGNEIPGGEPPCARPWKGWIGGALLEVDGVVIDLLAGAELVLPRGWWEVNPHIGGILDLDRMVTDFSAKDFVRNLFGFALLGPLLVVAYGRRLAVGSVMVIGAVLSLSIETAQIAIPGRYPSLTDLLLNVAGAIFGAWFVHARLVRKGRAL